MLKLISSRKCAKQLVIKISLLLLLLTLQTILFSYYTGSWIAIFQICSTKLSLLNSMSDISGREFKEIPFNVYIIDDIVGLPFSSWLVVKEKAGIEVLAEYLHKSINVLDFVIANYSWKLWRQIIWILKVSLCLGFLLILSIEIRVTTETNRFILYLQILLKHWRIRNSYFKMFHKYQLL